MFFWFDKKDGGVTTGISTTFEGDHKDSRQTKAATNLRRINDSHTRVSTEP